MKICPHPACNREIPRYMFACSTHWFQLPKTMRDEIWRTYDGGQGVGTKEYVAAARAAEDWIAEQENKIVRTISKDELKQTHLL